MQLNIQIVNCPAPQPPPLSFNDQQWPPLGRLSANRVNALQPPPRDERPWVKPIKALPPPPRHEGPPGNDKAEPTPPPPCERPPDKVVVPPPPPPDDERPVVVVPGRGVPPPPPQFPPPPGKANAGGSAPQLLSPPVLALENGGNANAGGSAPHLLSPVLAVEDSDGTNAGGSAPQLLSPVLAAEDSDGANAAGGAPQVQAFQLEDDADDIIFEYTLTRESKQELWGLCVIADAGKMVVGRIERYGLTERKNFSIQSDSLVLKRGDIIESANKLRGQGPIRHQILFAWELRMTVRRPTTFEDNSHPKFKDILRTGGVLMATTQYDPRAEPEHDSGYLTLDKGTALKIFPNALERGNYDNVYGEYVYAKLYSPTEEQLKERENGTYPCLGWVPTDVLNLPTKGWCDHHNEVFVDVGQ